MDILTNKKDIIIEINISITEEGNLFKLSDNNGIVKNGLSLHSVETLPSGIEVRKYCYNETDGFYKNLNYRPPTEERIDELETALASLMGV